MSTKIQREITERLFEGAFLLPGADHEWAQVRDYVLRRVEDGEAWQEDTLGTSEVVFGDGAVVLYYHGGGSWTVSECVKDPDPERAYWSICLSAGRDYSA